MEYFPGTGKLTSAVSASSLLGLFMLTLFEKVGFALFGPTTVHLKDTIESAVP